MNKWKKKERTSAESQIPGIALPRLCQQMATGSCKAAVVQPQTAKGQGQRAREAKVLGTAHLVDCFAEVWTLLNTSRERKRGMWNSGVFIKATGIWPNLQMACGPTPGIPRVRYQWWWGRRCQRHLKQRTLSKLQSNNYLLIVIHSKKYH